MKVYVCKKIISKNVFGSIIGNRQQQKSPQKVHPGDKINTYMMEYYSK
jgi:hypothetical protein